MTKRKDENRDGSNPSQPTTQVNEATGTVEATPAGREAARAIGQNAVLRAQDDGSVEDTIGRPSGRQPENNDGSQRSDSAATRAADVEDGTDHSSGGHNEGTRSYSTVASTVQGAGNNTQQHTAPQNDPNASHMEVDRGVGQGRSDRPSGETDLPKDINAPSMPIEPSEDQTPAQSIRDDSAVFRLTDEQRRELEEKDDPTKQPGTEPLV